MAVELPIRVPLSDDGVDQLIAALLEVGRMAGMTEKELKELSDQAKKGWRDGRKEVNDFNKSLDQLVAGGLKKAAQAAAGFFAAHKLLELGKQIFDVTAQYQRLSAVLTNALGSRSQAQQSLRMLEQFAAKTPFQVDKLTESYVKLVNQGFRPTQEELRKLGDLSASVGKDFDQLTEAIIDAQTGEFERLKEFGIRAQKEGDNVIFTFKGVQTQVEFTSKAIREYIVGLGDLQGVSGSMASISETIGGKLSNLRDTVSQILTGVGNRNSGLIGGFLDLVSDALEPLNEAINDNVTALRREQSELNVLVGAITDVNVPTEVRKKLIEDLNRKYPDFLKNLDAEKVTNEQLVGRLKDVNEQFSRKILLAAAEKELAKSSERIIELVNKEAEARLELEQLRSGEKTNAFFPTLALVNAERKINMAMEERQKLTQENIDKLKRYQEALGIFNETNNDYFETTEEGNDADKKRTEATKGLIANLERRIKLLQEQRKHAESPEEIRRLKIEIEGLTKQLERLNALGAGVGPVIRQITSAGLGLDKIFAGASERLLKRFEKDMDNLTKVHKKTQKDMSEIYNASFRVVDEVANAFTEGRQARAQAELDDLEKQKDYELSLAGDNARAREAIERDFDQRQRELKTRQAQRDKDQSLFNIFLNTAQGVVAALASVPPNLILSLAIAAIGAAQGIAVQSRPLPRFAKGKYRIQGPGTPTSDSIPALISRDESVVPASRNAKFGFALKPIIENDNFTIKDLKDLVDAHVPMQLRGDLFRPKPATDLSNTQLDEVNRNLQRLLNKKEFNLSIDEDGFKKWVRRGSEETEYLNKRYSFDA